MAARPSDPVALSGPKQANETANENKERANHQLATVLNYVR